MVWHFIISNNFIFLADELLNLKLYLFLSATHLLSCGCGLGLLFTKLELVLGTYMVS